MTRQKLEQATSAKELAKVEGQYYRDGHKVDTDSYIVMCACARAHTDTHTHTHSHTLNITYYCFLSWWTNTRE